MPRDLALRAPPTLAIAEGATTPDPGMDGALVWSSTTGREMVWNDTLGAWHSYVPVHVGPSAPSNPGSGDLWVDTGSGAITDSISANQNNYSPTGLDGALAVLITTDQARVITGLAGGADGRELWLINVSTAEDADLVLRAENASSSAANRFITDADIVIERGDTVLLRYEAGSTNRWRPVGGRRKYTSSAFRLLPFYCTDFLGAAGADTGEATYAVWDYAVIASGTQAKVAGTGTHPGILRTSSSTTTNSGGYCRTAADAFLLAGGEVSEHVFRLPDLTTLTVRLGFIDTATSADCVDGAYIEIPSTGQAVGKTSNNSTRTTSSTIATLSANTWYRARIVVNKAATAVDFYLFDEAGNLLGSQQNTANIPTGAGRETGHGYIATKSGTTAQACIDMDYMSVEFTRALI